MAISRRKFIVTSALVGGGVLIGYSATRPSRHRRANDQLASNGEHFVTSWIKLDPDNKVTIYVPHSEMGQGVHTSLAMMAADEMDAAWELVSPEQAPAMNMFANGDMITGFAKEFGVPSFLNGLVGAIAFTAAELANLQTTGGSASVRFTGESGMRVAGAAAREMLIQCAAARWGVSAEECTTQLSHVHHNATGRSISYGELAADAAKLEPPKSPTLKDPSQFNIMGKAISRVDIPPKVDGTAPFGLDAFSEDMLFAALRLAPVHGSKLLSIDASKAESMRGVKRIVQLEDSVAVVADNYWRAKTALAQVDAEFEATANDDRSSETIFAEFDASIASGDSNKDKEQGDAPSAFESSSDIIEGQYRVPFLAHAAMEPMNCTVHIHGDKADLWTSTQDALSMRGRVASVAGLAEEDVTFHQTYCGGGFGRRLPFNWNVIDHATLIAKEFDVPVKTVLSREDDMQQDYYRPAVSSNFRAGFDAAGNIAAWENIFTGPISTPGAAHIPYDIPNQSIRYVDTDLHVQLGAWRSVDHSQHTFFTESFIDEAAHRARQNPYQFRMDLLRQHPRHQNVLKVAAESAGYGANLATGRAMGIAVQESFGSIAAQIVEVSLDGQNQPVVHKVTCAIDCGRAINPDTVEAQVESGVIFGLSAALYGEIKIENGRVANNNFPDYDMVRLAQTPEIVVEIVESGEALGGLGEPATPPIAAAVANGLYILTGQRVRELPLRKHDFSVTTPIAAV